jgi:hypothetical protein
LIVEAVAPCSFQGEMASRSWGTLALEQVKRFRIQRRRAEAGRLTKNGSCFGKRRRAFVQG